MSSLDKQVGMTLETMQPTPTWDPEAHADTVATFESLAGEIDILVWGGDWCPDCRKALPDVAAALDAAGVPEASIESIAVDRDKQGPKVDAYDIEYIPTVVIKRDGEELARFVESEPQPAAVVLAEQLAEATNTA